MIVSMLEQPNKDLMEKYGVTAVGEFAQVTAQRLQALAELVEKGALTVRIEKAFPLTQAADALAYLAEKHPNGKVILQIR